MKKIIYLCVLLSIFVILIPLVSVGMKVEVEKIAKSEEITSSYNTEDNNSVSQSNNYISSDKFFKILDTSNGKIIEVSDTDFTYGAVAAEISYTFQKEMLKAQAVAAYTYYSKLRENEQNNPTETLKGADFSCDLSKGECYATEDFLRKKWGDSYDKNISIIKNAVNEVIGEVLIYNGSLALTCYHAISYGVTENSENIFIQSLPYLTSVASPGDVLTAGYCTTTEFTADELKNCITANYTVKLNNNMNEWININERSQAGTVMKVTIGDKTFTGTEIRNILSLRSANFTVVYSQNKFIFTVYGYGHSVGMSQCGGEYMAEQGADYKEILSTYYQGTEIKNILI